MDWGKKVVVRSFFKIELRNILLSVEVWPTLLPTLRHLLLNMNKRMEYLSFYSSLRASRILGRVYCKNFKLFHPFFNEKRRVEFKITFINSEITRIFFYFCKLFRKLMIELRMIISKKCRPWRALFRDIFFHFGTLFIDLPLFAFGKLFYRLSRVSALLWLGGSISNPAEKL